MPTEITDRYAKEKSVFVITVELLDSDEEPITPNEVSWTLTDIEGNVMNDRSSVTVTPASSFNIVLSGDDLLCDVDQKGLTTRTVTVKAVYDDTEEGNDLPLTDDCTFYIKPAIEKTRIRFL